VNDTVGHAGGDDVLREFASRLREELRTEDVCGRWGGEEFLVLLPGIDIQGARIVAERVCERILATPFPLRDGQVIAVTVSGGCATGDGCDSELLVRRADDALYAAKAAGRNRIELAGN
jgi:diguanylate cyclase (GGDEF)-like protein